ncbi:MAG: amino acid ABC transporter permease [Rhizobium sp.]
MIRGLHFGDFAYILFAFRWTLLLWIVSCTGGVVLGLAVALLRLSARSWLRGPAVLYVRIFQGTPLLIQILIVFFVPPLLLGIDLDPLTAALAALTINASSYMGEVFRGSILAMPKGQSEAATALGLHAVSRFRFVILPQAFRIALPALVGFSVMLMKATSLAYVLGFVEITKAAHNINAVTFQPFAVFGFVGAVYFAACWPLSLLSQRLERKISS